MIKLNKGTEEYNEFRRKANERNRKYYSKPDVKAKKKIYKKAYDIENKKRNSEYGAKLRATPEYQERIKKWIGENKEYLRLKAKEYRGKNREKLNAMDRARSKRIWKDPVLRQKEIEWQKMYRKEYPENVKKYKQKYNQTPKGRLTSTKYVHKRLARIHGNGFDLTKEDIKRIRARDKVCVYCGTEKKLELDHVHPLAKGGETTYGNMVIACRRCNSSKGKKDVEEWKLINATN